MNKSWSVRLHQVFKGMYAQKFTSSFKDETEIEGWIELWSGLECDVESMQAALKLLPTQFPEWPPTLGQFKALLTNQSKPYVALPPPVKTKPNAEQAEILRKVATAAVNPRMPWWTPDKVRNQAQVDFIVMQAKHFGKDSDAGRFLYDCISAGVITQDLEIA
jgi:hypothetical protein